MTINEKREANKRTFIKKKLTSWYHMMKAGNSSEIVVLNCQNSHFRQFTISYDKAGSEYRITNPSGNGCSFVLGTTYISSYVNVNLYDTQCQFLLKTEKDLPFFLYRLLEQFEHLESNYLQMMERFDKLEKSAGIIRQWIEQHFGNSIYDYHLTETDHQILLSIAVHNHVQLSVPVYYAKYKQILPHIMATVQAYEDIIASTKIKVFISEISKRRKQ